MIDSYRRRQQMAPYFMAGLAVLLVVVGIIILVVWFSGSGKTSVGSVSLFASATPTVTITDTATSAPPTATLTVTPTVTETPTITISPTPSGPFEYTVQEGDTCWGIAEKFKVGVDVLLVINNFGSECPIKPKDKIMVPQPGAALPTPTAISNTMTGKVEYTVQTGDSLGLIADRHNSTIEAIMKENKLKDANAIQVGQKLVVPVNIITPVPTKAATATLTPSVTPTK